ncbi:MAG: hypothetical protein AAF602_17160, partial [Myxococcota bacterium]
MTMVLFALGLASAVEPDAEITVYGDALAPWDGTRWWVASETIDMDAPLQLFADRHGLMAPAWQAEAVLRCRIDKRRRKGGGWVRCDVEDAAVRVATYNQWQRPSDRRQVDKVLKSVIEELEGLTVRLRVMAQGTVRLPTEQEGRAVLASTVLGTALDAFHLEVPDGGWSNGSTWHTTYEPLLKLNLRS